MYFKEHHTTTCSSCRLNILEGIAIFIFKNYRMDFKTLLDSPTQQTRRNNMVRDQLIPRGINAPLVIQAMLAIPRDEFVCETELTEAYNDYPLPIGFGQTISQPYIVAFMTEMLSLQSHEKVLEIGTGSGYQTAVLSRIVDKVFTIEIVEQLASQATKTLKHLAIENVRSRAGDGYHGWPEQAPFDAIILTAAPEKIPQPLLNQLAIGGRIILPLGNFEQKLILLEKTKEDLITHELLPVSFVPMTGEVKITSTKQEKS